MDRLPHRHAHQRRHLRHGVAPVAALLVVALAGAGTARADATADVTALVKKHVLLLATTDEAAFATTLANDARMVSPYGTESLEKSPREIYYFTFAGSATHAVDAVTVAVDPATHTAWFAAAFTATIHSDDGVGHTSTYKVSSRIGGLAIDDHGWKIAGVVYVMPTEDAKLLHADPRKPHAGAPVLEGDAGLASAVAGWFPGKLAAARTSAALAAAAGTAPKEVALTAAGAGKLAATWDQLKLGVAKVKASVYAGGTIGFAVVDVEFPVKGGIAPLTLGVVAVKEKTGGWRWSALVFTVAFTQ